MSWRWSPNRPATPPRCWRLDLDLEADLGIDTVKQAELFAQIREKYGIERDDKLKLRDYPTLNHVVGFVRDRTPHTPTPETPATAPAVVVEPTLVDAVGDEVAARVVALVAEQTGYPAEMLAMDLDLEADLGIDTVKQAELFAQIREEYGIERDDKLKLRDYPTLNHVVGFVHDRTPHTHPRNSVTAPAVVGADARRHRPPDWRRTMRFPRRVPVAVVRHRSTGSPRPGCQLGAGCRVFVLADTGGVAGVLVDGWPIVASRCSSSTTTDAENSWPSSPTGWPRPDRGLFALAALDNERPLATLDLGRWSEGIRRRVKLLADAARELYDDIDEAGTFVVCATRKGGPMATTPAAPAAPWPAPSAGSPRRCARERPAAIGQGRRRRDRRRPDAVAERPPRRDARRPRRRRDRPAGAVRLAIGLEVRPAEAAVPARALTPDTVVVATGAAGSIVSAIIADLARAAGGGTFHLLDLIPEPDPADPDLARYASDRDGLKGDLAARITQRGERATPVLIERELAAIERRCAALAAIEAITSMGGTAHWYAADLRDGEAIGKAASAIRATSERVDVLLHAAGLEISRLLPTSRLPSSISSSTSKRTVGSTSSMPSVTCRSGRRWCSARSPGASAMAARPTTAPPTTCSARACRRSARHGRRHVGSPSTGQRGRALVWPAAARSRR